ncbi:MAG: hypothetical protein ACRD0S_12665, partial [Acidimicrobiales bacterium]
LQARWREEHDRVLAELKETEAAAAARRVELDRDLTKARKDAAEAEWHLGVRAREVGRAADLGLVDYLRQAAGLSGRGRRPS